MKYSGFELNKIMTLTAHITLPALPDFTGNFGDKIILQANIYDDSTEADETSTFRYGMNDFS